MRFLLWGGLALSIIGFLLATRRYQSFRRGAERMPWYMAGNVPGSLSLMLLFVAILLRANGSLAIAAISASIVLLVVDMVLSWQASQHRS